MSVPVGSPPPPSGELMIEVRNLVKRYGSLTAVDDMSFSVQTGSLFAFLGTNGAGKSTAIACLTTLLRPTSGSVWVCGFGLRDDPGKIRAGIGVVFQESILDSHLTVRENLDSRASLYGLRRHKRRQRIDELTQLIGLENFIYRRYGKLSGGQRRRVDVARALLHEPKILFLDEPTTGLDVHGREMVWESIHAMRQKINLTVFLTTHYLEESDRADNVCIVHAGKVISEGTPPELKRRFSQSRLEIATKDSSALLALAAVLGIRVSREHDRWILWTESSLQAMEVLQKHQDSIEDFEFRHGNMDDVFINLSTAVEGDRISR